MKQIEVLFVSDYPLMRSGIRALLEKSSDVRIVAEAGDGRQALSLIRIHKPDVALICLARPNLNGLNATTQVTEEFPTLPVVILSMHTDEEDRCRAIQSGAAGYLLTTASLGELELAIRAVAIGKRYISPPSAQHLITASARDRQIEMNLLERLTPRQLEVLQLIAEGKSTKQIALILNISGKTVESHRSQLMQRLGIHATAGLVRYAVKAGLIRLED